MFGKKHLFLQIIYREAFITCSLGIAQNYGPPACSTHLLVPWPDVTSRVTLEAWRLSHQPAQPRSSKRWCHDTKASVMEVLTAMTKGTDTFCTHRKLVFFHYYGCQKIEDFGLKLFQKHLEQVEKGCLSNKFGPFTLPMPRTSSSPCHIVGVVAHLPRAWSGGLWDLHASWVVSSAWIWMASLLMALGSLVMAKLKNMEPPHIPSSCEIDWPWASHSLSGRCQHSKFAKDQRVLDKAWPRSRTVMSDDWSFLIPCLRIKGGDTLHRMKS